MVESDRRGEKGGFLLFFSLHVGSVQVELIVYHLPCGRGGEGITGIVAVFPDVINRVIFGYGAGLYLRRTSPTIVISLCN